MSFLTLALTGCGFSNFFSTGLTSVFTTGADCLEHFFEFELMVEQIIWQLQDQETSSGLEEDFNWERETETLVAAVTRIDMASRSFVSASLIRIPK